MEVKKNFTDHLSGSLTEEQREAFPTTIYEYEGNSPLERAALIAALDAAINAGLAVVSDSTTDKETKNTKVVIRTASTDRLTPKVESALFHGATVIASNVLHTQGGAASALSKSTQVTAKLVTESALRQIVDDPGIYQSFSEYYGGLRWSTDQEKFTGKLFRHGTDYDPDFVSKHITGNHVSSLAYDLELDIPYDEKRDWGKQSPLEIFQQVPQLDYRQLTNPVFVASPDGQKLLKAYAQLSGSVMDERRKYPDRADLRDLEPIQPVIPLSRFPIVEALLIDEVSLSRPKAKYDFGPSEVVELILGSDSLAAQRALVDSITHRLPRGQRSVFDGPDEFQHKRYIIHGVIGAYKTALNPERREEFKHQLFDILGAYQADGVIAQDVRANHFEEDRQERPWHRDTGKVKAIVSDILASGLSSSEPDSFMSQYMANRDRVVATTETDPLELNATEMMTVVLDALKNIGKHSRSSAFEEMGQRVFHDDEIAAKLRIIVEKRIESMELWQSPSVSMARRALQKFGFKFSSDDRSPEEIEAQAAFNAATRPSETLSNEANNMSNDLLMSFLENMSENNLLDGSNPEMEKRFQLFLKYINFGGTSHMRTLPDAYIRLAALAKQPTVPDELKASILYLIADQMKYSDDESSHLFMDVILDGYSIMLGSPEDPRMPIGATHGGLGALNSIASDHGVFRYASSEQLAVLTQYKIKMTELIERALAGSITTGKDTGDSTFNDEQWSKDYDLKETARAMAQLEELYEHYLLIEDVKVKPDVYYPWLMRQLVPFYRKMQREVDPGNRPTRDIQELYNVLEDYIKNKFVLKSDDESYPENFDAVHEGNLDTFLMELYTRMVLPYEIKNNGTVWREGLSFMYSAINLMPPTIRDQIKARYPNHQSFNDYLDQDKKNK